MPHVPPPKAARSRLERDVRFLFNRQLDQDANNSPELRREWIAALQRTVNDASFRRPMLTVTKVAWGRPAAEEKADRRHSWERVIRTGAPRPSHVRCTRTSLRALNEADGSSTGEGRYRSLVDASGPIVTESSAHVSAALDEHAKIIALQVALEVCLPHRDLEWRLLFPRLKTAIRTAYEQEVVPNLNERRREREALKGGRWARPDSLSVVQDAEADDATDRAYAMEDEVASRVDSERAWKDLVHRFELSPIERKLLFLEARVGLSAREAAAHLGLSESYARVAKNRIRERVGSDLVVTLAA